MYFGLCNSPATFQTMMNEIFVDMEDVVVVYINDLMIFTKTDNQEEHDRIMLEVLCRLDKNDLFVMYFRLCNSPATFQTMMNKIFMDMEDVVVVYINDLMIFTKMDNQEEHDRIVLEVLHRLEENDYLSNQKNVPSKPQRLNSWE